MMYVEHVAPVSPRGGFGRGCKENKMSRLNDAEIQAEELNRGAEDRYYGEPWPTDDELRADAEQDDE